MTIRCGRERRLVSVVFESRFARISTGVAPRRAGRSSGDSSSGCERHSSGRYNDDGPSDCDACSAGNGASPIANGNDGATSDGDRPTASGASPRRRGAGSCWRRGPRLQRHRQL
jgi:hypothetical protein